MRQEHIPWREQIDLNEVEAMSDEYGWDEWLAEMEEGGAGQAGGVRRVSTPMPNFQRHNNTVVKTARATNWDSEFAAAQSHARDVLAKLGNL